MTDMVTRTYTRAKHFAGDDVTLVDLAENHAAAVTDVLDLPLIVTDPVTVRFCGKTYRMDREGLYRFREFEPKTLAHQIFFQQDVFTLFASICRVHIHGRNDPSRNTVEKKLHAAKTGKLTCNCGPLHALALRMLEPLGIRLRRVQLLTLEEWNRFDNGHILLEYFYPDEQRWVLVDLDCRSMYTDQDGRYLDVYGLTECVNSGRPFQCRSLCTTDGMNHSDVLDTFGEDTHLLEAGRRLWLERIAQVPMVDEVETDAQGRTTFQAFYPVENEEQGRRVADYGKAFPRTDFRPLSKAEWFERFYPDGRGPR